MASPVTSDLLDCEDPLGAGRYRQHHAGEGPSSPRTSGDPTSLCVEEEYECALDETESEFLSGVTQMTILQEELEDVRQKLAKTKSNGEYIPLRLYRSGRWNSISVTDIQSGLWCEVQLEYKYLHPHMKATLEWTKMEKRGKPVQLKTPSMKQGANIHLKKELEVHEIVTVKTVTREDKWAVDLVNTYAQLSTIKAGKLEREINVFGDPFDNDILIKGIIDQVEYSNGKLTVLDYKTRKTNTLPSSAQKKGHALQLMIYKQMLDGLTCGHTDMKLLVKHLGLHFDLALSDSVLDYIEKCGLHSIFDSGQPRAEDPISEKDNDRKRKRYSCSTITFGHLVKVISELIACLQLPLVTGLLIQYEYQKSGVVIGVEAVDYNEEWMKAMLEQSLSFWRGRRPASGVDIEDLWKCDHCQFRDVCVWRMKKVLESSPAARRTTDQ